MASIPNQTNIAKIVLKQAQSTNKLVKVIFNDIQKVVESAAGGVDGLNKIMPEVKTYMEFIKSMNDIFKIFNELAGFDKEKIKNLKNIVKNVGTINGVIQTLLQSMQTIISVMLGQPIPKQRSRFMALMSKVPGLEDLIDKGIVESWTVTQDTMPLEMDVQKLKGEALKNVKSLLDVYKIFLGLLDELGNSKLKMNPISMKIIFMELNYALKQFNRTNTYILESSKDVKPAEVLKIVEDSISIAEGIRSIFDALFSTKTSAGLFGRGLKKRINKILKGIECLNILINYINKNIKARDVSLAKTRIANLVALVGSLHTLVSTLVLMTIPLVLFIMVSPILFIGFFVLRYFLLYLVWVSKAVKGPNITMAINSLVDVFARLTILAAAIVVCAIAGIVVLKYWKELVVFFIALSVIVLLVAGFALLSEFLNPLMAVAITAMGLVAIFMLEVLAVGVIMIVIAALNINQDALQNAMMGITNGLIIITEGLIDAMSPERIGAAWLALLFLGPMVLVCTMILVIAFVLLLIQEIKLSKVDIQNAVLNVLDTAQLVVDCIFDRDAISYDEKTKNATGSKKHSWLKNFFTGLGDVLTAVLAVAYVALIFISVAFIFLIALMLEGMSKIQLEPNDVKNAVNKIMLAANSVIEAVFNPVEENSTPAEKGWFRSIIESVGGPIVKLVQAIMAVVYVALVAVTVGFIYLIANMLKGISEIDIKESDVTAKVSEIMKAAHNAISAVFQTDDGKDTTSKRGWIRKLLGWVAPNLMQFADAIMAVGILAVTVAAVGLIHVIANQLNDIQNIELKSDLSVRVTEIISSANAIASQVTGQGVDKSTLKSLDRAEKYYKALKRILPSINEICGEAIKLSEIQSFTAAQLRIDELIEIVQKIDSQKIDQNSHTRLNYMSRLGQVLRQYVGFDKTQVDQSERLINNYVKFVDKVNNIKLESLQSATAMFKQMSEFSQSISGDFDKLADSLNEKIAPLLEELKTLMEELPSKIDESTSSINSSISANSTNTNMSSDEAAAQARRNDPNATEQEIERRTKQRMDEQARIQSASVITKIDELLETIRGNSSVGPMPVRMS